MIVKKKQLLTATLVLALGAAVFVNWYYTKPHPSATAADSPVPATATQAAENLGDARYVSSDVSGRADPFAEPRLKREQAHSAAVDALQEVLQDASASQAAVSQASQELAALTERMTCEADIETLVQAKTGMENLVILGEDSAQILLAAPARESAVMIQITELAAQKSGLDPAQITIIESSASS